MRLPQYTGTVGAGTELLDEATALVVEGAFPAHLDILGGDLGLALRGDLPAAQNVVQERHHVGWSLRTAKGQHEKGVEGHHTSLRRRSSGASCGAGLRGRPAGLRWRA